jgi:hypothetical protein
MAIEGGFDPKEQNQVVQKWASMVQRYLRSTASGFVHGKESSKSRPGRTERKLANSIRASTRKSYGVIDRATFSFERHGVFVHKGVGRGYEMQGGMVQRTAKSVSTKERKPNEWFNPILEQTLPELANKLAEINADAVLNATKMMIK